MIRRRRRKKRPTREFVVANHRIRFPEVRVIDEQEGMLGVLTISQALQKADEQGKDLVLVTAKSKPPVTKIIELAKFKYQQKKKKSEGRKKAKSQEIKGVRFTQFMEEGDFQSRIKKTKAFLEKGNKVKIEIKFGRGRAITKRSFVYEMAKRVVQATQDMSIVEIEPKIIGRKLIAQLAPNKPGKNEKIQTEN